MSWNNCLIVDAFNLTVSVSKSFKLKISLNKSFSSRKASSSELLLDLLFKVYDWENYSSVIAETAMTIPLASK